MSERDFRFEQDAMEQGLEALSKSVRRLSLRTETLPPATHTNAYFVGWDEAWLVDPATTFPDEQERLGLTIEHAMARGLKLQGIVLTHEHPDHWGAAEFVRTRFSVPVLAHRKIQGLIPVAIDQDLEEGETLSFRVEDESLDAQILFTPGHAVSHISLFLPHTREAIVGDMVAGVGTILIDPRDGDLRRYLQELRRLQSLPLDLLHPAHGPSLNKAPAFLEAWIGHRLKREERVMAAIRDGRKSIEDIAQHAYADSPQAPLPLTILSTRSHLQKLLVEGRVIESAQGYELGYERGKD